VIVDNASQLVIIDRIDVVADRLRKFLAAECGGGDHRQISELRSSTRQLAIVSW
jgi:hypothetical protein